MDCCAWRWPVFISGLEKLLLGATRPLRLLLLLHQLPLLLMTQLERVIIFYWHLLDSLGRLLLNLLLGRLFWVGGTLVSSRLELKMNDALRIPSRCRRVSLLLRRQVLFQVWRHSAPVLEDDHGILDLFL